MPLRYCFACSTTHQQAEPCPKARNGSTRGWRRTRAAILQRDGQCQECGAPAQHVDHKTTRAMGGTDDVANLQALCADCNLTKGNT